MIEPILNPIFREDSYGYRPGKSAKQAIAVTRKRCWQYDWIVEFDMQAAFDQIDHALLMKALRSHIKDDWILRYIERWLTAPFETADGVRLPRTRGTPQGGVVSPLLMNLFMHYAFDHWMKQTYPQCPFARYADDAVVHCRTQAQAEAVMRAIALRLEECGLTMHPDKSKIAYCKDSNRTGAYPHVQFTFLGFSFRPREALNNRYNRRFTSFLPAVSSDALKRMRQTVRDWHIHRRTSSTLENLAQQCNPTIQGWWNYYGTFYQRSMRELFHYIDNKLEQWARRKYKTLSQDKRRGGQWLRKMKMVAPCTFVHWRVVGTAAG
jgi:group II intron reverse transcriptase/maturase